MVDEILQMKNLPLPDRMWVVPFPVVIFFLLYFSNLLNQHLHLSTFFLQPTYHILRPPWFLILSLGHVVECWSQTRVTVQ